MSTTAPAVTGRGSGVRPPAQDQEPKRNRLALWLLAPASIILLLVMGYPIVRMVILSLQEAKLRNITRGTETWNNFENYADILGDPYFWTVVARTLIFTFVCVVSTMVLGTLVALLLNRLGSKMRLTVLIALLLAWATPVVTATQTWQFLFDTQFGVVNWALVQLGFDQFEGYSWLADPLSLLTLAAIIVVWAAIPFVALTLYAGLSQMPNEIFEAAALDGASSWTQFWKLVVPQLSPIFLILTALSTIWDFRVFTQVFILQKSGGITKDTDLLGIYAYRVSFSANDFGKGSAIGVIMVLMLLIVSVFYIRRMTKQLDEAS
jgi:N,N'-diacetylchitobiose transport system permease protein